MYLAAEWACLLHEAGPENFHEFPCESAAAINTNEMVERANLLLDINPAAGPSAAIWFSDNQIIELVTADNPDGPGKTASWFNSICG